MDLIIINKPSQDHDDQKTISSPTSTTVTRHSHHSSESTSSSDSSSTLTIPAQSLLSRLSNDNQKKASSETNTTSPNHDIINQKHHSTISSNSYKNLNQSSSFLSIPTMSIIKNPISKKQQNDFIDSGLSRSHNRRPSHQSSIEKSSSSGQCLSPKLIKPTGRPKVNTLPPWAKSFEDDDQLFSKPVASSSSSSSSSVATGVNRSLLNNSQASFNNKNNNRALRLAQSTKSSGNINRLNNSSSLSNANLKNEDDRADGLDKGFEDIAFGKNDYPSITTGNERSHGRTRSSLSDLSFDHQPSRSNRCSFSKPNNNHSLITHSVSHEFLPKFNFNKNDSDLKAGTENSQQLQSSNRERASICRSTTTQSSPVFSRLKTHMPSSIGKKRASNHISEELQRNEDNDNFDEGNERGNVIVEEDDDLVNRGLDRHHNNQNRTPDDRWWQFTLPTKYRKKVEEYISRTGHGIGGVHNLHHSQTDQNQNNYYRNQLQKQQEHLFNNGNVSNDAESIYPQHQPFDMTEIEADRRRIIDLLKSNSAPLLAPYPALDPNQTSPYLPHSESSPYSWRNSLNNEDNPLATAFNNTSSDFPLSAFSRKMSLTYAQQQQLLKSTSATINSDTQSLNPINLRSFTFTTNEQNQKGLLQDHHQFNSNSNSNAKGRNGRKGLNGLAYLLLHHPMAPLICRLFNFCFTIACLGICLRIRGLEKVLNQEKILGNSTIFIIIVTPFNMVHNMFAIYCEYFGAPIGIWSVSWKMFHTLSELVFISIWSAALAVGLDDELTSRLRCTVGGLSLSSSRAENRIISASNNISENSSEGLFGNVDRERGNKLCSLQGGLVGMIFCGLMIHTLVLVVSLFRIFNKVSRKY